MKPVVLLLIGILYMGCSSRTSEGGTLVRHVDLSKTKEVSVFDLVDSISVVALETNDSCLISYIYSIKKKDDKLYILDGKQDAFFLFQYGWYFLVQDS